MHTTTLTRVVGLAEWDALRVVLGLCRSLQCGHGGTLPVAESSPSLDEWCPWLIPPRVWISLLSLYLFFLRDRRPGSGAFIELV